MNKENLKVSLHIELRREYFYSEITTEANVVQFDLTTATRKQRLIQCALRYAVQEYLESVYERMHIANDQTTHIAMACSVLRLYLRILWFCSARQKYTPYDSFLNVYCVYLSTFHMRCRVYGRVARFVFSHTRD